MENKNKQDDNSNTQEIDILKSIQVDNLETYIIAVFSENNKMVQRINSQAFKFIRTNIVSGHQQIIAVFQKIDMTLRHEAEILIEIKNRIPIVIKNRYPTIK